VYKFNLYVAVMNGNFKVNTMNNICDLYLRYLGKCNLYREVTQFRKQEQHSKKTSKK